MSSAESLPRIGELPGASDINVGFTLLSGYLVFFMQAGFAMLSAGSVRAKNAKNIILLNLLDACFGCIAWYATGYAFAFGDPSPSEDGSYPYMTPFIGHRFFFQNDLPRAQYVAWFFQFTFAATAATIVSGAVAERCRFETYICYNLLLVSFVYPVVAHWVWSPFGWLSALRTPETSVGSDYTRIFSAGVYDFAGDGPVHMLGGFASLAGAWILGPRLGRFTSDGTPVDMPGHSASLTLLGVFLLWFGWFGFNPGSTNAIVGPTPGLSTVAAAVAVNTTVSAAAATISTLFVTMLHNYRQSQIVVWDLIIAGNGALAGLVSITGGCAFVETWAAFIIGLIGGGIYYVLSKILLHKLKIDDPLDAIAVHAGGGIWGMLGCAAFASKSLVNSWYPPLIVSSNTESSLGVVLEERPYGFLVGGDGSLLAAHLIYILAIAAWTLAIMIPFFLLLKKIGILRVPADVEVQGLDISYHGGHSYPHGEAHVQLPGGGAGLQGTSLDRYAMEELIDEALRQVELRGWSPPSPVIKKGGMTSSDLIDDGVNNDAETNGTSASALGKDVSSQISTTSSGSGGTLQQVRDQMKRAYSQTFKGKDKETAEAQQQQPSGASAETALMSDS